MPRLGFTLIELLIVVAIIGLLAGLSIPFAQSMLVSSDLATEVDAIAASLRRAQQQAMDGLASGGWGVHFEPSQRQYTLFQGATYASRDSSFDQTEDFTATFALTTDFGADLIFTATIGLPSASGTVSFSGGGQTGKVQVNSQGRIEIGS